MVRARKRFGQHFLEPAWVAKVVQAIGPQSGETFLEIGPGRGALTRPLAASARQVLAYEIDHDLAAGLRGVSPNVTIVDADFLSVSADDIRSRLGPAGELGAIRVAGNLPYNVATPILFRLAELFEAGVPFADATLMLQHEVAARLVAAPGSRAYGVLSILIRLTAQVERLLTLPPGAFRPAPKVTSAVVRLRFGHPPVLPLDPHLLAALVHTVFSQRRKTISNALKAFGPGRDLAPTVALERAGLDGRRRPETMTLAELTRLADIFSEAHQGRSLAGRR